MGFGKAFGFSLLAFIGLNVVFFLIGYGISGTLINYFTVIVPGNPLNILQMFFGPIIFLQFPYIMTETFVAWITMILPFELGYLFLFIGFIVAPFLAAFLSGRFGENKLQDFMGWFVTVMICAIVVAIVGAIGLFLTGGTFSAILNQVLLSIAIGLVLGLAYGSIALLTSREF